VRVEEAKGIAEAQKIINTTLTPNYLQHEAIKAQEKMASSPNHTTVYIPSGTGGIPRQGDALTAHQSKSPAITSSSEKPTSAAPSATAPAPSTTSAVSTRSLARSTAPSATAPSERPSPAV